MVERTDHQAEAEKRVRQGGSGIPPCRTLFRCGADFSSLRRDVLETVATQRLPGEIFFVYARKISQFSGVLRTAILSLYDSL